MHWDDPARTRPLLFLEIVFSLTVQRRQCWKAIPKSLRLALFEYASMDWESVIKRAY